MQLGQLVGALCTSTIQAVTSLLHVSYRAAGKNVKNPSLKPVTAEVIEHQDTYFQKTIP